MFQLIFGLFVFFVGGGYLLGKMLGIVLFPDRDKTTGPTYIDNSVHHHHHHHEHKSIHIIDETTKKEILLLKDGK